MKKLKQSQPRRARLLKRGYIQPKGGTEIRSEPHGDQPLGQGTVVRRQIGFETEAAGSPRS